VPRLRVIAGGAHACALDHGGRVPNLQCWGAGAHGEVGQGDRENRGDSERRPPAPVDLGAEADSVVAGGSHTCAILGGGRVKCWGDNGAGQLGLGDTETRGDDPGELRTLPFVDLGDAPAGALSLGTRHSCALLGNGVVKCWGDNSDGQLGLGDTEARGDDPGEMGVMLPGFSSGRGSALAVSAGAGMTCALYIDGSLVCRGGWGFLLVDIPPVRASEGGAGVALGEQHACTWSSVDELVCKGVNFSGQLGRDPTSPGRGVDLGSGFRAERVSAGANHSCGVSNGRVKCWGLNLFGALGIGTTEPARGDARNQEPAEMGDMLPLLELGNDGEAPLFVNDVSAGNNFTCAALGDSQVKCWGANHSGQLGLGHTEHRGDRSEHMGDALGRVWIETRSE
jgi:alpha-tubulin suppressor-like RCC1 family protein